MDAEPLFETERLVPLRRHLGPWKLFSIKAETIAAYQQARIKEGVSGRTVNMEISVLGRMLKKAKLWAQMADDISKLCVVKTVSEAARHVRGNENSASSKAELELLDGLWSSGREFGKV